MIDMKNRSRIATTVAALALLVTAVGGSISSAYAKDDRHDERARIQQHERERRFQEIRERNDRERRERERRDHDRRDNDKRRFEWHDNKDRHNNDHGRRDHDDHHHG